MLFRLYLGGNRFQYGKCHDSVTGLTRSEGGLNAPSRCKQFVLHRIFRLDSARNRTVFDPWRVLVMYLHILCSEFHRA